MITLRFRSRNKLLILLLLLIHISTAGLYSADLASKLKESWRLAHFSISSGLPSNTILGVYETSDGIIWTATSKGFAWYDGFVWHTVKLPIRGISFESMKSGQTDTQGNILICSEGDLYKVRKNGIFREKIEINKSRPYIYEALPLYGNNVLLRIREDADTESKLVIMEAGKIRIYEFELKLCTNISRQMIFRTNDSAIWINGQNGLYRIAGSKVEMKLKNPSGKFRYISALQADKNGNGLIFIDYPDKSNGLYEIKNSIIGTKPQIKYKTSYVASDINNSSDRIISFVGGYVYIYTNDKWELQPLQNEILTDIFRIKLSSNGNLWLGTNHGLYLYRLASERFEYIVYEGPDHRNLVNEIICARNGDIWVGSSYGLEIRKPNGEIKNINSINNVNIEGITAIAEDKEGKIWIGSGGNFKGAFVWDGRSWTYNSINGFEPNIHKIAKDKQGRLWFLTISLDGYKEGYGAFCLDSGKFKNLTMFNGLIGNRVYSFADDGQGSLWFGTSRGLSRLKGQQWKHWTTRDGMPADFVYAIEYDQKSGLLWFSNMGYGIHFIDKNDRLVNSTIFDNYGISNCIEIAKGKSGDLWFATAYGVFMLNGNGLVPFTRDQGMNYNSAWPLCFVNDKVLIGTFGGGINVLSIHERSNPLPKITYCDYVQTARENLIRFRAESYFGQIRPEFIEVQYRIDNGDWSQWTRSREIKLMNADYGQHTIQIRCKGLFGETDDVYFTKKINITEPLIYRPIVIIPSLLLVIVLLVAFIKKMSSKNRMLRALEESMAEIKTALDNSGFELSMFDKSGRLIFSNNDTLSANPPDSSVSEYIEMFADKTISIKFNLNDILAKTSAGEICSMEAEFIKDGESIFLEYCFNPVMAGNAYMGFVAIVKDITLQKTSSSKLIEEKYLYQLISDNSDEGLIVLKNRQIQLINPKLALMTGWESNEARNLSLNDLFDTDDAVRFEEALEKLSTATDQSSWIELKLKKSDGANFPAGVMIVKAGNKEHEIILLYIRDISITKSLEQRLNLAQEEISVARKKSLELNEFRSELLASISHEYRTPLTIISTSAELLKVNFENTNQAGFNKSLGIIHSTVERMIGMLDDILLSSKLEHQQYALRKSNVNLPQVANDCIRFTRKNDNDSHVIELIKPNDNIVFETDELLISIILSNLLSNACNFSEHGTKINVTIRQSESDVILSVKDQGQGIAADDLNKIFEPFYSATKDNAKSGTGFGLTLVKAAVIALNGEIAVESQKGKGSVFTVTLPR